MKKLLLVIALVFSIAGISPVHAATWTNEVQAAIQSGNFEQINVIGAKNPSAAGDIAVYLLQQSQNKALSQDVRVKLFTAATPFAGQIAPNDTAAAGKIINAMLALANNPAFQKTNPNAAADIYASALNMSGQPNMIVGNPNLHNAVLADADDFLGNAPADADKRLREQVSLALFVGAPPPLGPRGIINPSFE
ncbi:MAG: hypothetical protein SFW62_09955 [Alphaproteobacteria bacterium]|nr:hypothetical protein [Alphaproteobacteria bacterium]